MPDLTGRHEFVGGAQKPSPRNSAPDEQHPTSLAQEERPDREEVTKSGDGFELVAGKKKKKNKIAVTSTEAASRGSNSSRGRSPSATRGGRSGGGESGERGRDFRIPTEPSTFKGKGRRPHYWKDRTTSPRSSTPIPKSQEDNKFKRVLRSDSSPKEATSSSSTTPSAAKSPETKEPLLPQPTVYILHRKQCHSSYSYS